MVENLQHVFISRLYCTFVQLGTLYDEEYLMTCNMVGKVKEDHHRGLLRVVRERPHLVARVYYISMFCGFHFSCWSGGMYVNTADDCSTMLKQCGMVRSGLNVWCFEEKWKLESISSDSANFKWYTHVHVLLYFSLMLLHEIKAMSVCTFFFHWHIYAYGCLGLIKGNICSELFP